MASEATISLPYDIVGYIIDILAAEGDLTPIKNASLASSSVLHLCRRHIFHTIPFIDFYPQRFKSLKQSFISLLVKNPTIVEYIRELDYEVHDDDAQLSPLLPKLLQTISHIECLRIRNARNNFADKFDWTEIDPLLRSALLRLMCLPTLTQLDITRVRNLPISALASCINLEQLDIHYITVTPFEYLELNQSPSLQTSHSQTPRILRFRNDSSETAVGRLLQARWEDGSSVLDFTHLKTLVLDFDMFENVQITRELFENVRCLEELHINAQSRYTQSLAGLSEVVSLARNLRTLQVRSIFQNGRNPCPMIGLCEELEALVGDTLLQVLKFAFVLDGCEPISVVAANFRRLEGVLMNPGWSALKCVSIEIHIRCCHRHAEGLDLESVPEVYLSRLLSRKILHYTCPVVFDFAE